MTTSKITPFPHPASDKMPFPPTAQDLGADEEAATHSAQTFARPTSGRGETRPLKYPNTLAGRWHTPLLLAVAAIVASIFLFAAR